MNTRRHTLLAAAALVLALSAAAPAIAQTVPKVEDAWARPTVAGQAGGGGFLRITSATADRLVWPVRPFRRPWNCTPCRWTVT